MVTQQQADDYTTHRANYTKSYYIEKGQDAVDLGVVAAPCESGCKMTETLHRPQHTFSSSEPRRFSSARDYARTYPYCEAYSAGAQCSSASAIPGCDYVARGAYWFTDELGQAWLVTFSRHRADVSLPRGEGRGNVVACNVGLMGPPVHWGGTGEVLVLAENIAMDQADDLMNEYPHPSTLAQVRERLR